MRLRTDGSDGGPAFPRTASDNNNSQSGMSRREWYAGQALVAVIAMCANDPRLPGETHEEMFARKAHLIADAMLKVQE